MREISGVINWKWQWKGDGDLVVKIEMLLDGFCEIFYRDDQIFHQYD